jgi:hypothetical protein
MFTGIVREVGRVEEAQVEAGGELHVEVVPWGPTMERAREAVSAALEGLAVREACRRLTDADLGRLGSLVEQMRLLVDHPAELTRLGRHPYLIAATASPRATSLMMNRFLRLIAPPSFVLPPMPRRSGARSPVSFTPATPEVSNS